MTKEHTDKYISVRWCRQHARQCSRQHAYTYDKATLQEVQRQQFIVFASSAIFRGDIFLFFYFDSGHASLQTVLMHCTQAVHTNLCLLYIHRGSKPIWIIAPADT
ncbi:TPA: hypothetical protein ACH3X2_004772 [Trebouxia sp. C0005]